MQNEKIPCTGDRVLVLWHRRGEEGHSPRLPHDLGYSACLRRIAYIGECDVSLATSIELNDPVTLMGCGGNSAWGVADADGHLACTRIVLDSTLATPGIYVRGDPVSGKGFVGSSGDTGAQGISIIGMKAVSAVAGTITNYNAEGFIKFDGTYADEEVCTEGGSPTCAVDGCTPGTDCRASVREVYLKDVGCFKIDGYCFDMVGNVFDVNMEKAFSYYNGDTGLIQRDLADGTCNNTGCLPKQIVCHDCLFISCDRDDGTCDATTWAASTAFTYFDGGHIQGDFGLNAGANTVVIGTHIESIDGAESAGNIGVQVIGKHVEITTDAIDGFANNLVIGTDGSAVDADGFIIEIGTLTNASAVGLVIEDGVGNRDGDMNIGNWVTNAQDVDNQANKGPQAHLYQRVGIGLLNNATALTSSAIGLAEDDVRIGDRTAADQWLYFENSPTHTNSPFLQWDESETTFLFAKATGLMFGSQTDVDQTLTFDVATGDGTLIFDWVDGIDDAFVFNKPLLTFGDGSGDQTLTLDSDTDETIMWDDSEGEFALSEGIQLGGRLLLQHCANTAGAGATAINNCNMVTLTGATAITSITNCDAANRNRMLVVDCGAATLTITDGGNLDIFGNLICNTDADTLVLICDGSNWLELSRSKNN
jgi:hypothetical protein